MNVDSPANLEAHMAYQCPACSRSILSRRNKLCSFCGAQLPAELLFTPAEVEAIEAAEQQRALARKLREEERLEAARRALWAIDPGGAI